MHLQSFIEESEKLCKPDSVQVCSGLREEYQSLLSQMVEAKTAISLSARENSFYFRSDPADVARVEKATYICSEKKEDAGPTNNWANPKEMREKLKRLFEGSMKGRTMYVIPYAMGPVGGPITRYGVEITDSPYVVCNMYIMARMGPEVLQKIEETGDFVRGLHSVGLPLEEGKADVRWPCNEEKYITHFPETREIFSFGSGYGGNALLGKKCFALRIASKIAKDEGWLAEHMLIIGVTNPKGIKRYIAAAFPSACGKTNMAMMFPKIPGWKVECVGDDIAWMRFGEDGKLYAINPENGFFGVAPGTSYETNPHAMKTIEKNTLFTNVALTGDGDIWWEGMTKEPPEHLTTWKGKPYQKGSNEKASHPNARFTAPMHQCPVFDPSADDPQGVEISAIIFGGRRASLVPLVTEAKTWEEGVLMGAGLSSEMTAAAEGKVGKLRRDPMAMLPFCGYHMADYFSHWLDMKQEGRTMPKVYSVNWFRKKEGKFIWPGFGDNIRVLEWIFDRCEGKEEASESALGFHPRHLNLEGLEISEADLSALLAIDAKGYLEEMKGLEEYFASLGEKFPKALRDKIKMIKSDLQKDS